MLRMMLKKYMRGTDGMAILVLAVAIIAAVSSAPCSAAGTEKVTDIAVGHGLSVALLDNGTVWTWGNGQYGALGIHGWNDRPHPSPRQVSISNVIDIAAGSGHVLALKSDGTVWAWGENDYGQLGDGTTIDRNESVQVRGLSGVKTVAAGLLYSIALKEDGTVWAWGFNTYGQLGDGSTSRYEAAPVKVAGLSSIVKVYAGYNHNIAIDSSGNAWAWGSNDCGELGDGTTNSQATPVRLSGLTGIKDVAIGSSYTVALLSDGTVHAWGENYKGWLGDGTSTAQLSPVAVKGLDRVTAVWTGEGISFAAKDDGTVWAWGLNSVGLIGNGDRDQKVYRPSRIGSLANITQIAVGPAHVLGIKNDGSLWAWGDNQFGQIGTGVIDDNTYVPTRVTVGHPATITPAPTSVPGNNTGKADNSSETDTAVPAADNTRYILMGISILLALIAIVGALIWLSRR